MGLMANIAARAQIKMRDQILEEMDNVAPDMPKGAIPLPCHIIDEVHNSFWLAQEEAFVGVYLCQDVWWARALTKPQLERLRSPKPESTLKTLKNASPQEIGPVSKTTAILGMLMAIYSVYHNDDSLEEEAEPDVDRPEIIEFLQGWAADQNHADISEEDFEGFLSETQEFLNSYGVSLALSDANDEKTEWSPRLFVEVSPRWTPMEVYKFEHIWAWKHFDQIVVTPYRLSEGPVGLAILIGQVTFTYIAHTLKEMEHGPGKKYRSLTAGWQEAIAEPIVQMLVAVSEDEELGAIANRAKAALHSIEDI
jgi:hypothetical protein